MPSEEHEQMVAMMAAAPPGEGTLQESRDNFEAMTAMFPLADDVQIESLTVAGCDADRISIEGASPDKHVLYLHGGGYVIGSNVGYREFSSRIARALNARVLVLNYRLAPENPHPAAVDDAVAAYKWMLEQGIDPGKLSIAGDSAGGGLTVATLVALRDQGVTLPASATVFSPWVDLEVSGETAEPGAVDDPMLTVDTVKEMAEHYAQGDLRNPLVSPLHANLNDLPPMLVFVGTREVLLSDATRLVDNAQAAGVHTKLVVEEGLIHVWPLFGLIPEATKTLQQMAEFTAQHTG